VSESVQDRRAHPRVDTAVDLRIQPDEGGTVARVVTGNLSLGGLYCTSQVDIPEMTRLAVRLMLPGLGGNGGEEPVDLQAVVVRRRELPSHTSNGARFELALYFTSLDDMARARLSRYLDTQR